MSFLEMRKNVAFLRYLRKMDKCPVFCWALGGYVKHDAYVVEALAAPMSNFADRSSCTFGDPRTLFTLYEAYVLLLLNVNIEKITILLCQTVSRVFEFFELLRILKISLNCLKFKSLNE